MNKLFAIYIGGAHEKSLIELHDMRFVVAETIEHTYPALKQSWWGTPESLHLDAWGALHHVDGYDIHLKNQPAVSAQQQLYFLNLGGYDQKQFTELHKNIFVVAENDRAAKTKALQQAADWEVPHKDYQFEIEKIVSVDNLLADENFFIHLTPSQRAIPFEFTCMYVPIGKG